jgi:hypothetical protein
MVAPEDEVSSYTLMEIAAAGLVYHSTVGLEVACKGKAVVAAAGSLVSGMPFARTVVDADGYEALLDELRALGPGAVDPEVKRLAHRFAYGRFFRTVIPFPLVRMPTPHEGRVAWSSLQDLVPGRDAGVDRCADILFGAPPCPPPSAADRARDTAAEDAFLAPPTRRFTALAYAHELIEDRTLLSAWASAFTADDDATLVIHTPAEATEALIAAVGEADLEEGAAPDLLAVGDGARELEGVDVLFSRKHHEIPLPRFDDAGLAALRAHADRLLDAA